MTYPHAIRLHGPWEIESAVRWQLPPPGELAGPAVPSPPAGPAEPRREGQAAVARPLARRVRVPSDWSAYLPADFRGQVRYHRFFNGPSHLDSLERVWLVVDGADAFADVYFNCRSLGRVAGYALPAAFPVTHLLRERNELHVDVALPLLGPQEEARLRAGREGLCGGLVGELRLEIRSPQYLDGVSVHAELGAAGPASGEWPAFPPLKDSARRDVPIVRVRGKVAGEPANLPLNLYVLAAQRERFFGPIELDQTFEVAFEMPDLPRWELGAGGELVPITIKLLRAGAAAWEKRYLTALPPQLGSAGSPHSFSSLAGSLPVFRPRHDEMVAEPDLFVLPEIMPESWYTLADQTGCAIVQAIPAEWGAATCPRLAHHPAIVAWARLPATGYGSLATGAGDWPIGGSQAAPGRTTASSLPSTAAAGGSSFGRRWFALETQQPNSA
jgi:hypothetical protein